MIEEEKLPVIYDSPPWSRSTKVIVTVVALILVAFLAYRFKGLLQQLIIAAMLAYLLNPLILVLVNRSSFKRVHAILLVYFGLAVLVVGGMVALGVAAFEQSRTLLENVPAFVEGVTAVIRNNIANVRPINLAGYQLDPRNLNWETIQTQLLGLLEPTLGRGGQIAGTLASATLRLLGIIFFIFIISIYFAAEIPYLSNRVGSVATAPGYRQDVERIMRDFGRIWNAYLRGQVVLALTIFFVVWIGLTLLGVQNSLALGLLAGLLEFIPVIGPVVSAITVIIVAFFQPDTLFALPSWQYTLLVLAFMILVQQLENNILVPRIVGNALELNPIVVIIAVLMGGSIAGILGMILAAPVMASLKLVGGYAWRKLFDLPPFIKPEPEPEPMPTTEIVQRGRELVTELANPETNESKEI